MANIVGVIGLWLAATVDDTDVRRVAERLVIWVCGGIKIGINTQTEITMAKRDSKLVAAFHKVKYVDRYTKIKTANIAYETLSRVVDYLPDPKSLSTAVILPTSDGVILEYQCPTTPKEQEVYVRYKEMERQLLEDATAKAVETMRTKLRK